MFQVAKRFSGLKYLDHLAKMVDGLTGADGQLLRCT